MRLRGSHFALLTIASFVLLFVYSLFQLVNIDRAFREEIVERNLWAANQADREAQNLMLTLYRVSLDRDVEDVLLRFEILYSRIALMADRPQIDYLRAIGADDLVFQAKSLLEELDGAFMAEDFDATDLEVLTPRVAVLSSVLREITNITALDERIDRHVRREALLQIMQLLLLAVGGAFLTGVVMAGLLWRNMRRSMRAQAELQAHRAELERTVAARTTELQEALEVERRAKEVYRSFIVTVSHQFRTPVSIIHMIAQRQLRGEETPLSETLRRKFSRILDAAERLERLLSGFLASASVEGKDIALSRRLVDFNEIARIAAHYNVPIVEDDIYGPLIGGNPPPIFTLAESDCYYICGTSKTVAPGLRIGYLVAPPRMVQYLANAVHVTTWSAPPLNTEIVTSWIESGTAEWILDMHRAESAQRLKLARDILSGFDTIIPEIGYHLWLRLPKEWHNADFVQAAYANGVAVSASTPFAVDPADAPPAIRVSLGLPKTAELVEEGLIRLRDTLLGYNMPKTIII